MRVSGAKLANADRRLLAAMDRDERWQQVKVPISPSLWDVWGRYCELAGISMGRGIDVLIDLEVAARSGQNGEPSTNSTDAGKKRDLQAGKPVAFLATVAIVGTAAFVVLIAALHFLSPDINPIERPTSDYAVGPYGYLMTAAWVCLSLSTWALVIGLRRDLSRPAQSRLGLGLLGHRSSCRRNLPDRSGGGSINPRGDHPCDQRSAHLLEFGRGHEPGITRVQTGCEVARSIGSHRC